MVKKANRTEQKTAVLSDHKKVGKRFVPPFMQLGNFHEIEWVRNTLPEVLWLGLLNYNCGLKDGSDLAVSLAKAAVRASAAHPQKWHAPMSSYSLLTGSHKTEIIKILGAEGSLPSLKEALIPLVAFYPECPVTFLFGDNPPCIEDSPMKLEDFKSFLAQMYNKYEKPATLAQANAIYVAFATDMLKVVRGSSLAEFPAIANFPNTEKSKRVAASVYASIPAFIGKFLDQNFDGKQSEWSAYFWNHGLDIEPCSFYGVED